MAMGAIDVTPTIPNGKRMHAHVVIRIEVDIRNVVARIADENVTPTIDDKEGIVIWRVIMRMNTRNRAPVLIAIHIKNGMRTIIGNR